MENKFNCLICGEEIMYTPEKSEVMQCFYCGKKFTSNTKCKNSHYVCDSCHSKDAYEIIMNYCIESTEINPVKMAKVLMKHPSIKMHGPEHHFLIPAVLISSYYNKKELFIMKKEKLQEAAKRAKNVLGGFCGLYGSCGAGIGTGIFISIVTGATPLSKEEWKLSNLMTSKSLYHIAENGGPRCCKRDSFIAINEAIDFCKKNLNVDLEKETEIQCEFNKYNTQCIQNLCPFFQNYK